MSCQSSGVVQSYPVPVCGPVQPSKPNPAWGLNAQNHSKCILVMAMVVLPTVSRRHTHDHSGAVVLGIASRRGMVAPHVIRRRMLLRFTG